ncbi:hypothetical protein [Roseinatronobacter alkalisoli]|uniref:VCBS repeat-containing protein n=1 Tax=Roseinatronobacter alkalisoli TaxID=3028235 RepID=A0ABT5T3E8_9RHOB|nr:hypothetical protein [Roseinatronobacter sp. HJB301]MDD7969640.1 hypothetical protein [Roseinatronobacter sp. HJB301]
MIRARRFVAVLCIGIVASTTSMAKPVPPLSAKFSHPTNRYPHNVLGDLRGFAELEVTLKAGTTLQLVLPENRVFEHIAPRLWDVDGDGIPEIVAVESDQRLGRG